MGSSVPEINHREYARSIDSIRYELLKLVCAYYFPFPSSLRNLYDTIREVG